MSEAARRFQAFWEGLTPQTLGTIGDHYAADAFFKDPFNEVRGIPELQRIFGHMFATLHAPRFQILQVVEQGTEAFFIWDFTFRVKKWQPDVTQTIHGTSHVRFDATGRVQYHRDYWDAANELYAKLPVIGRLMRWLAKRMG